MEDLIKALQIFSKYTKEDYPTWCEHDCLHVRVCPEEVLLEDIERLEELGFRTEDAEDFYSHKYGSC